MVASEWRKRQTSSTPPSFKAAYLLIVSTGCSRNWLEQVSAGAVMKSVLRNVGRGFVHRIEANGQQIVRSHLTDLEKLEFYHTTFFGGTTHFCEGWRSADHIIHNDAPITVVVTRKNKVAGVVGFEITGRTLLVRQLQGSPKASFHDGVRVEAYLLECAEKIAATLQMAAIRVITPETAIAFREAAPAEDRPSEHAKRHMRKIYAYPGEVGYTKSFCWRLRRRTYHRSLRATVRPRAGIG
jgi:hypothetical protein